MFAKRICSIGLVLLIAATCAQAETLTLGPTADTWVRNSDTTPHGSDVFLYIADTAYAYAYMRFDLSSYNITDISSAKLSLRVAGVGAPRNDNVVSTRFALNGLKNVAGNTPQDWDEATLTSATVGAEWTTSRRPLVNVTTMDSDIAGSGMTEVITLVGVNYYTAGGMTIDVSGAPLAQFLKDRVNDGGLATLIIDFGVSTTGRGYGVVSKEGTTAEWRPVLTLEATVGPKTAASKPSPADKATEVIPAVALSWTPGDNAVTHKVYFGTSQADVNAASAGVLVAQTQEATFDPVGSLVFGAIYYWRVDEVEQNGTVHPGAVWSFTVEAAAYPIQSAAITASASSNDTNKGPANTANKSGLDATGLLHGTTDTGTMWLSVKTGPQPTWIQYDFDRLYKLTEMWVWNYNNDYESLLGMGIKNAKVEYSADGITWTSLGDVEFAQAPGTVDYAHNTTVNLGGIAAKSVKITANSSFGTSGQYGLSEVRFFYIPVVAQTPKPAINATDIAPDITLGWRAGREAASHQVYMGTDPNALTLAGTVAANSFAPAGLVIATKYYWRVDEVNTAATPGTWTGDLWNFSTPAFIVIDDMESYNDKDGTSIFNTWPDGYNTTTNGAQVGLDQPANGTYCERTIVHGGQQSMPFIYGKNSISNSETTRTFEATQDWTAYGVKTLTLYFRGLATNTTTVPLWVKVTDASGKSFKVTFGAAGEDTSVLADPAWTTWNIPLSSLSGVTLSKVKSMTIGVGTGTGTGTLYIDDIRLYPTVTPPVKITPTLAALWKLDNDVKDSSGNGNNGTANGGPTFVAAGKLGASLKLDGTDDYVDCGAAESLNITDQITLSAWIKPGNFANAAYQTFVGKGDHAYCIQQTNGNVIQFYIYSGAWYTANSAAVTSTMNAAWHHVAGTYDGTQLKLFVDGVMVGSSLRTGTIATATHAVNIGRNSENSTRFFPGEIDEVRIYRGPLSTPEIKALANP
jgi:hypothetical protein